MKRSLKSEVCRSRGRFAWLLIPLLWLIPENGYCYLDPGAGSSLIALLAGGFSGLVVLVQLWKNRFFGDKKAPEAEEKAEKAVDHSSENKQ